MRDLRWEQLRELGQQVRALRLQLGLTGRQLAERADLAQPTVSKIETGRMLPSEEVVRRLAVALRLDEDSRAELFSLLRRSHTEVGDLRSRGAVAMAQQEAQRLRARRATAVESFQCAMVPSLLQSGEYARRTLLARRSSDDQVVARVVASLVEAQSVLYEDGRRFSFVLTEGALRTWPGSSDMMPAQLSKILDVSTLPNVFVGVVPWSVSVPELPLHGFVIYDGSSVAVQTFTSELLLTDDEEVAIYRRTLESFREVAVTGDAMREVVSRIARDYAEWAVTS